MEIYWGTRRLYHLHDERIDKPYGEQLSEDGRSIGMQTQAYMFYHIQRRGWGGRFHTPLREIVEELINSNMDLAKFLLDPSNNSISNAREPQPGFFTHIFSTKLSPGHEQYIKDNFKHIKTPRRVDIVDYVEQILGRTELSAGWFCFLIFLYENANNFDENISELMVKSADTVIQSRSTLDPRQRPFSIHHAAITGWNLIQNDITASSDEAYNMVIVEHPSSSEEPQEHTSTIGGHDVKTYHFPQTKKFGNKILIYDKEIPPEHRRPMVVIENNATIDRIAINTAYGNLMEAMRPMYKGELYLLGNERINPWDIIHVNDMYKEMKGPIEVNEVIHHFSQTTGFITVVKPHLLVTTNDENAWVHSYTWQNIWGHIAATTTRRLCGVGGAGLVAAPTLISVFIPYALPIGLLASYGTYELVSQYMDKEFNTTITGLVLGQGWSGKGKHPIDVMPLTKHGYPYVAGLRTTIRTGWSRYLNNRWEQFKYYAERASRNQARLNELRDMNEE